MDAAFFEVQIYRLMNNCQAWEMSLVAWFNFLEVIIFIKSIVISIENMLVECANYILNEKNEDLKWSPVARFMGSTHEMSPSWMNVQYFSEDKKVM